MNFDKTKLYNVKKDHKTGLTIAKSDEYVWRSDWCGGHHGDIPCYWVFDGESLLEGRVNYGSNVRSGYAKFTRLRDVKAWANGYFDAMNGVIRDGWGYCEENKIGRKISEVSEKIIIDTDAASFYEQGQDHAKAILSKRKPVL